MENVSASDIETLFFVKNDAEYQTAIQVIENSPNFLILSYTAAPPYLSDHLAHLPYVEQWQNHTLSNPETARFWLMNYEELDQFVTPILSSKKKWNNELFLNPYFKQGVISLVGEHYVELAKIFDQFFSGRQIKNLCFVQSEGYFSFILSAFANRLGINYLPLSV